MLSRTNYNEEGIKLFEVQGDTVYIRSNPREIIDSDGDRMWEYEEKSLPLATYIEKNYIDLEDNTSKAIVELTKIISDYQKQINSVIAELSILIGGLLKDV